MTEVTEAVTRARERLLAAIGDALPAPATDEQQTEILDAIATLVIVAGHEALVLSAESYTRVLKHIAELDRDR